MNEPTQSDGGSAFPMHERDDALRGMSLRDYFAGQAIAGRYCFGESPDCIAKEAYGLADAMLKARAAK